MAAGLENAFARACLRQPKWLEMHEAFELLAGRGMLGNLQWNDRRLLMDDLPTAMAQLGLLTSFVCIVSSGGYRACARCLFATLLMPADNADR